MYRSPFSNGFLYWGIPSPRTTLVEPDKRTQHVLQHILPEHEHGLNMVLTWLYDFARGIFDDEMPAVEVREHELKSTQRLHQANPVAQVQIVSITPELL